MKFRKYFRNCFVIEFKMWRALVIDGAWSRMVIIIELSSIKVGVWMVWVKSTW